jgi:zinc D-Ala-D-Ala dipeptidase
MIFSDCNYDVVEFNNELHPRIVVKPMYFELGFSPSPLIFGRSIVLSKLLIALNDLPSQYGFQIWDVYRPREVQKKLFEWMRTEIRKQQPNLSDQENYVETQKYMSAPSEIGDAYCPPHLSGGAIDLTLFDITQGKELDMGTSFDDCTERAWSGFFSNQSKLSAADQLIKERRESLQSVMQNVGFVTYQYEWWHFDIGNIFWSRATKREPVFGPLFGDKEWREVFNK